MLLTDLTQRTFVDTDRLKWVASPGGEVLRKRLFHCGPSESGQVTSIVRYDAGARFPEHAHPDGEEIFVLRGTFSDHRGDWKAGTLLLNPEGFRHAPRSESGCDLLVRLRQYAGANRRRVALDTNELNWQQQSEAGVEVKTLYRQEGFADSLRIERWAAGLDPLVRSYPGGVEIFVLSGQFSDDQGVYPTGSWLRLPEAGSHCPRSIEGCELYVKEAGLAALSCYAQIVGE